MKKKRKIAYYIFGLLILGIFFVLGILFFADWRIKGFTEQYVYDDIEKLPYNSVGLVLGTTKKLAGGYKNLYFSYRMEAAAQLYRAGKISCILVSGDGGSHNYNEPKDMRQALIEKGIPEEAIALDYAGFRTLDSVIRCYKVFGQKSFTIISQKFQNQRGIYIARSHGIQAIGFNAKDVAPSAGFKTRLRERFARVKALLDLTLGVGPKFLGDKIQPCASIK